MTEITESAATKTGSLSTLRLAELQIHRIVALNPAVLFVRSMDPATCEDGWVSDTIHTMLGYTPAETLAPGWWEDNLHPEDRAVARQTRAGHGAGEDAARRFYHSGVRGERLPPVAQVSGLASGQSSTEPIC